MKTKINSFTAYTNCPPGEYGAIFNKSEVKKYPKGEREILTFLILSEDGFPLLNNKGEARYSAIVCNKSKGESPKSKISKIKTAMLDKKEYDPITCRLGLPDISNFYGRIFKVRITSKADNSNFITHIQKPRDLLWECIECEFEGKYRIKVNLKSKLNYFILKIIPSERSSFQELISYLTNIKMPYMNYEGYFTGIFDEDKFNNLEDGYLKRNSRNFFNKINKFLESNDISEFGLQLK